MERNHKRKARPSSGIRDTLRWIIFRAAPRLFIICVCGVLIARYFCHLPIEQTAVGVGAPLVSLLFIGNILPAYGKEGTPFQHSKEPVWLLVGGVLTGFSVLFSAVSLMSSVLYRWIGLLSFAKTSLHYAIGFLCFAIVMFAAAMMLSGVFSLKDTARKVFWEIPSSIADQLSHWRFFGRGTVSH